LGEFTAEQERLEQEQKRLEIDRRSNLTPEERAREDQIEIEKLELELQRMRESG